MGRFMITYDITDNKIRNNVFKTLKELGLALQKSVFTVELSENQKNKLQKKFQTMLKENDSVIFIPCCNTCFNNAEIICTKRQLAIIV